MDCPTCKVELKPDTYESVPLFLCPQCSGYLVKADRLLLIKGKRAESIPELQQEVIDEQAPDTVVAIKCPRCRARRMRKEALHRDDGSVFNLDRCDECEMIWLDGGELARLQIDFETSSSALSQYVHQQRHASRDSEQRAEFDQRLEENQPRTALTVAANELTLIGFVVGSFVTTVVLLLLSMKYWSLAVSPLFFAAVAFWAYNKIDDTLARYVTIGAAAVFQLGYLIYILFFS